MGLSGVAFWDVPCFSGDSHSLSVPPRVVFSVPAGGRVSGEKLRLGLGCSRVSSSRYRMASGFSDGGHLDYYRGKVRCGGEEKGLGSMTTKKKLKLLKGLLSEDLSMFSGSCGEQTQNGLVGEVQGKLISEAAEVLIKQLQHVRSEEKEMKKKKKMEKAKLRASRMKESSSSSSTSSSSSESENGEVMDMSLLRREVLEQPIIDVTQTLASATLVTSTQQGNIVTTEECGSEDRSAPVTQDNDSSASYSYGSSSGSCSSNVSLANASGPALTKSIEVCMGNKCKKSGAAVLLEEFERVVGIEGAVVGCKCMGKCRDGPNVRVSSREARSEMVDDDSVRTPPNPLCIKVGLEDVDHIVAKFLSEEQQGLGMAPTC